MSKRIPIKVGNVTGYVTSSLECVRLIEQLQNAMKEIDEEVILNAPLVTGGFIDRDAFYKFIHQMNPREDIRRSDGVRIYGVLARSVLLGTSKLYMRCTACGRNVTDSCGRTGNRHNYEDHGGRFSLSMASLKANVNQIRRLEGITLARYEKIQELIKFA